MSDIFREVDEEIRHDEYRRLWDRFGLYVIALGLLIVASVGGYKGWQAYQRYAAEQAGERYAQAVQLAEQGSQDKAIEIFTDLADSGVAGYGVLANFKAAAALAEQGRRNQAALEYEQIANNASVNEPMRNLARIRAALLLLDGADRREIERRVATLNTANNPWRNSAREILGLAAYKAGAMDEAQAYFNTIVADPGAPTNLRQRAQVMLSLLAPMVSNSAPKPAAEAAATN